MQLAGRQAAASLHCVLEGLSALSSWIFWAEAQPSADKCFAQFEVANGWNRMVLQEDLKRTRRTRERRDFHGREQSLFSQSFQSQAAGVLARAFLAPKSLRCRSIEISPGEGA